MKIADNYLSGLKKAYYDNGNEETWNHFEQIKHGASKTDIKKLQEAFPVIPRDWSICSNMSMGLIGGLMPMKKLPFSFWGLT